MSPRASREARREKRARAARPLLSPRSLTVDMAAGLQVVSRAGRYRQPSVGTAAPKGAGIAVRGAGHSCAPLRLSMERGEASTSACGGVMVPPPSPAMVRAGRQGRAAVGPAAPARSLCGAPAFSVRGMVLAPRPGPGDARLADFDYSCTDSSPAAPAGGIKYSSRCSSA